jgi:Sulfatase
VALPHEEAALIQMPRNSRRDLMIALSLANICYLRVWSELLTYNRSDTYLMQAPPGPAVFMAAMASVLLMAGLLWALAALARATLSKAAFRVAEIGFLVFLAVPLNSIRAVLSQRFPYLKSPLFELLGTRGVVIMATVLIVAGLACAVLFHRTVAPVAGTVIMAFLPFCAVTFGQAIWKAAHYDAANFSARPPAPLLLAKESPRVLWILCDEWDYRLTFVDPDPTLQLPQIARLRGEALFADHAMPPGPETPVSIPGYFTGKFVQSVAYDGPRELQVMYRGASEAVPWSTQPNIFARARELGFNTALVDWFHPTCRVLNGLSYCKWWELAMQHNSMGRTFWPLLVNQPRSLFETTMLSVFGQSLSVRQQVNTYHAILDDGLAVANDPKFGFSFVHLPIPHSPHAYDRRTGRFTLKNSPIRGYIDSLALLDRTLGEIRQSMIAAGTWDKTTVLMTSDHPYREAELLDGKSDPRIPFLLKLASQKEGRLYNQPFNAILTGDFLLAVLKGEVSDAAGAAGWLDQNRSRVALN